VCGFFISLCVKFLTLFIVPQNYPSILLEQAVNELSKLPTIGRKSALRLALHLLKQDDSDVEALAAALVELKKEVKHCNVCHNISDTTRAKYVAIPTEIQHLSVSWKIFRM